MGLKLESREFIGFAGRGQIFWCLILNNPIHPYNGVEFFGV